MTRAQGTATVGNGMNPQTVAQEFAQSLCQVVSNCAPSSTPVSASDCYTNIQTTTNIVPLLGASFVTYPTFGDLINSNLAGSIAGNTTAATSSVDSILQESCSSSAVQSVFSSGPANYSNMAAMIPSSSIAAFSPTSIFRSIGPGNTGALATGGSNSLTIAGTTATFTNPLPNNVGVGDALQYQVGSTWYIAFITSRASSTAYSLQTALGGTPLATSTNSSWSLFRAYTSLANAVDSTLGGTENVGINGAVRNFDTWTGGTNIVSANQIWNFALYADAPDSSVTNISGWTTSAANYVKVYAPFLSTDVGTTQRHIGVWDTTKAMLTYTNVYQPLIVTNDAWIDGLQIQNTENGTYSLFGAINVPAPNPITVKVSNNLIDFNVTGGTRYFGVFFGGQTSPAGSVYYAWNNIISNASTAGSAGIYIYHHGTGYIYNNTVYNSYYAYEADNYAGGNVTFVAKNNIAQDCAFNVCYYGNNGGSFSALSDYNLSGDSSSTGGTHDLLSKIDTFVSTGALNFELSVADTAAKGAGEDLTADPNLSFSVDISNITRTAPWDIGATTAH